MTSLVPEEELYEENHAGVTALLAIIDAELVEEEPAPEGETNQEACWLLPANWRLLISRRAG